MHTYLNFNLPFEFNKDLKRKKNSRRELVLVDRALLVNVRCPRRLLRTMRIPCSSSRDQCGRSFSEPSSWTHLLNNQRSTRESVDFRQNSCQTYSSHIQLSIINCKGLTNMKIFFSTLFQKQQNIWIYDNPHIRCSALMIGYICIKL